VISSQYSVEHTVSSISLETGNLGVWGSQAVFYTAADTNTQISDILPFPRLKERDRAKLDSGDGGVRP
jgi:hypothetical protein